MSISEKSALTVPGLGLDAAEIVAGEFSKDPMAFFTRLTHEYGPVFKLPIGDRETVFVNKADFAEQILRKDFRDFGQSPLQEELLRPMLGRSMPVVVDHDYWEDLHSIIMPMFSPKMLRKYFDGIASAIAEEVDIISDFCDKGKRITLLDFVRHGVFSALTRTIFVRGIRSGDNELLLEWFASADHYMNLRYLLGKIADFDDSPLVAKGRADLERITSYVYDLIRWRRANMVDEAEDMLDVLLIARKSDGQPLSDKEVRDNVVALFFGGQETTPSAVTWAFGLISANPDKREIMLEEVDRVLGGSQPTFQQLSELNYTGMILTEALRLYPPFSFIGRETLTDVEINGFHVPKGTPLGYVGWTIHRDPEQWPDPEAFKPERHLPQEVEGRSKCAFVAFGYGQRRCTGERVGRMEGTLMLAMLSQKFLLDHVSGSLPAHTVVQSIKPADGMEMVISRRARQ